MANFIGSRSPAKLTSTIASPGLAGQIVDEEVQLDVHLSERLLYVLDLGSGLPHEVVAMPPDTAHPE